LHDEEDPVPEYRPTPEQVRNLTENDEPDPPAPPSAPLPSAAESDPTNDEVETPPPVRTPEELRQLADD
jgi:hypothetical protein